jgi:hypothetical protein
VQAGNPGVFRILLAIQAMLDQLARLYQKQCDEYIDDSRTRCGPRYGAHRGGLCGTRGDPGGDFHTAAADGRSCNLGQPPFGKSSGTAAV